MLLCGEGQRDLIADCAEDYFEPGTNLTPADWKPPAGDVVDGFGGATSSMETSKELAVAEVDTDPELLPGRFLFLQLRARRERTPRDELRDSC
jgi:hypothetical protein